jgi:hypothetical protein
MLIPFVIFSVYVLVNLYLFFRLSQVSDFGLPFDISLGLIILFLTISPILIHFYSTRGSDKFVRILAYAGYMWMAYLVIFFPVAILLEFYNLIVLHSHNLLGKDFSAFALAPVPTFLIPCFISITANIYGLFEAKRLSVEKLTIKTSKLPETVSKITIVQISDLHLGITVRDDMLSRVIKEIENVGPDLIVSTGDLIDGMLKHVNHLTDRLNRMQAKMGKFAVLGNHEFYGGLKHSVKFLEDSGFTVLRGSGVTLKDIVNIAGVDYPYNNQSNKNRESEILAGLRPNTFTLLLKHKSDVDSKSLGMFDLQLSGHTHKGQIFPMNIATMFLFRHHSGFTKLPKGSAIYVSRGVGTTGPPVRLFSRPEITVIEVISEDEM